MGLALVSGDPCLTIRSLENEGFGNLLERHELKFLGATLILKPYSLKTEESQNDRLELGAGDGIVSIAHSPSSLRRLEIGRKNGLMRRGSFSVFSAVLSFCSSRVIVARRSNHGLKREYVLLLLLS